MHAVVVSRSMLNPRQNSSLATNDFTCLLVGERKVWKAQLPVKKVRYIHRSSVKGMFNSHKMYSNCKASQGKTHRPREYRSARFWQQMVEARADEI